MDNTQDPVSTTRDFAELSEDLGAAGPESETLKRVLDYLLDVVPSAAYGGVMIKHEAGWKKVVTTHQVVEQCAALQLELHEGPLWEPARDPGAYLVTDTEATSPWPAWCRDVAAAGIRSVIAVQLTASREDNDDEVMGLLLV